MRLPPPITVPALLSGETISIPVPYRSPVDFNDPGSCRKGSNGDRRGPPSHGYLDEYAAQLSARLDPIAGTLQSVFEKVRVSPKRVAFAEGEEDRMIRAANTFASAGLGKAILIGRETEIANTLAASGLELHESVEILNARISERNVDYATISMNACSEVVFCSAIASVWPIRTVTSLPHAWWLWAMLMW